MDINELMQSALDAQNKAIFAMEFHNWSWKSGASDNMKREAVTDLKAAATSLKQFLVAHAAPQGPLNIDVNEIKSGSEHICDAQRISLIAYGDARANGDPHEISSAFVNALHTLPTSR